MSVSHFNPKFQSIDLGSYPDCMLYADNDGVFCRFCDFQNRSLSRVKVHVMDEHPQSDFLCSQCRSRSVLTGTVLCDRCAGVGSVELRAHRVMTPKQGSEDDFDEFVVESPDVVVPKNQVSYAPEPKIVVPKTLKQTFKKPLFTAVLVGKTGSGMSAPLPKTLSAAAKKPLPAKTSLKKRAVAVAKSAKPRVMGGSKEFCRVHPSIEKVYTTKTS